MEMTKWLGGLDLPPGRGVRSEKFQPSDCLPRNFKGLVVVRPKAEASALCCATTVKSGLWGFLPGFPNNSGAMGFCQGETRHRAVLFLFFLALFTLRPPRLLSSRLDVTG